MNVEMHWFLRRPDEELHRYWCVRVTWTALDGTQQRAIVDTYFTSIGDAMRSTLVREAAMEAGKGMLCDVDESGNRFHR